MIALNNPFHPFALSRRTMLVHLQDDVGERPILDCVGKMVEEICAGDDSSRALTLLENMITNVQFAAWNYSINRGLPPRAAFYLHSSYGGANHSSQFTPLAENDENLDNLLTEPTAIGSSDSWDDINSLVDDNEDFLRKSANYGQVFSPSTIDLTPLLPGETEMQPCDELAKTSRPCSDSIEAPNFRSSIAAVTISDMARRPANVQGTLNEARDIASDLPVVVLQSIQPAHLSLRPWPQICRNAADKGMGDRSSRSGSKDHIDNESDHNERRHQPGQHEEHPLQRVETSAGQDEVLEDSSTLNAVQSESSKLHEVHADLDRANHITECSSRDPADSNETGADNVNCNDEFSVTKQANGNGQSVNGYENPKPTLDKLARRKGKRKPYSERSFQPQKATRLLSSRDPTARARQQALSIPVEEWKELAQISNKVIEPEEVYSTLALGTRHEHKHYLPFLTRLFFHSWGPYAFEQIRQTCSVLRQIANSSSRVNASPSNLMKALDEIDGSAVRRRSYLVQLLHQRQGRESFHHKAKSTHQTRSGRRIKRSKSDGTKPRKAYERADSQAMSDLMAYHYPELAREDQQYEERLSKLRYRLGAARNWASAWERKASACWMYPCGMIVHLSSET